jgi:hypothetical protein
MALKVLLVLAVLVCTLGHRDAAYAHVSEAAVSAVHDISGEDAPTPGGHSGHVAHHHCPPALNEDRGEIVMSYRLAGGRLGLPVDMAELPSRDIPPLPEPPTA